MRFLSHLLLTTILAFSLTAKADDDAMQILEKMTTAAKTLSYEGVFAYQSGKNLQSIRIFHRADNNGEIERMISLNGEAREVIRTNDMVTCINPEGKQVSVSRRSLGRGFPSDLPRRLSSAAPYYQLKVGENVRTAGRQAHELFIMPNDDYRYGYDLLVDVNDYLLLKAQLISQKGDVLEQFSFSSVNTNVDIPDEQFESQMKGSEMTWHVSEPKASADMTKYSEESPWQVNWLPAGFSLIALQNRLRTKSGADVEQRVYSDGLSSVSVFIEKIRAQHNHLIGVSHVGGINAFGTIMHAHFVTVVGEVPKHTVEKIGASISFNSSDND
ncbi:hypothetical protein LCGC14_1206210 [marine sediment metagenome]|uniref:MucB/RseB N-terminal domain-containing protein n=1 Tax=marine sediment metagenome TaxID=412755 RepID=A0A0F9NXM9_9ZZZZ|nr:transcriptional regulator [Methylophaga aminisulfidivorans]